MKFRDYLTPNTCFPGIYVGDNLFAWCGPGGLSVRCHNKAQKLVCEQHGCPVYETVNHKSGDYFKVPETMHTDSKKLRSLAEDFVAAAPPGKKK
jgi:hypothetical protein